MSVPFLEYVLVEHFGCVDRVDLWLSRLHAFVGPNDSGKSTLLDALRLIGGSVDPSGRTRGTEDFQRARRRVAGPERLGRLRVGFIAGDFGWACGHSGGQPFQWSWDRDARRADLAAEAASIDTLLVHPAPTAVRPLRTAQTSPVNVGSPVSLWGGDPVRCPLPGARSLRLDPDALRAPSPILTDEEALAFRDERGTGLAAVLDAIATRDHEAYAQLNRELAGLFPALKSIQLSSPGNGQKALGFRLVSGEVVSSELASEGMLYALGFLVLRHLEPVGLLLIEEPENGLHPARVREMVALLRTLSERQQVVMATHSPLVLNELAGDEITLVTRPTGAGSRAVRLSETPRFDERSRAYQNGELWLAYCDGVDEHDLLEGLRRDWEAP